MLGTALLAPISGHPGGGSQLHRCFFLQVLSDSPDAPSAAENLACNTSKARLAFTPITLAEI